MNCHFPSIPWETMGRDSEGSSPRTSQKSERRVGGSSIADPKGRGSRSCYSPPQRRGENAERSPRLRAYSGSGMRGEEALTRPESRRRSALHGHGPCALPSAPVGSGLRYLRLCGPAPVRLRAPPGPAPGCNAAYGTRLPSSRGACVLAPGGGVSTRDR